LCFFSFLAVASSLDPLAGVVALESLAGSAAASEPDEDVLAEVSVEVEDAAGAPVSAGACEDEEVGAVELGAGASVVLSVEVAVDCARAGTAANRAAAATPADKILRVIWSLPCGPTRAEPSCAAPND